MQKLKVNLEKVATRCEICHQEDLFDGFSGTCQRCKDLNLAVSQSKQGQVIDGKKETTAKGQVPVFVSYNLSEIIACVSMIVGTILFVFFPELIGTSKESIKYFVFFIALVMAGYNYAIGGEEGQARAIRIAVMMFVFALWQSMVRFFQAIN